MVSRGTVSAGAGRALLSIRSQNDRLRLAKDVEQGTLTVRQLEARAAGSNRAATEVHAKKEDPNLVEVAEELQAALAMRVRISGTARRGAVTVSYHTPSELARIHKLLVAGDELSTAKTGEEADSLPV
jgi:ParB family chromosome partitioning protein